jgi:hypothetical protein
LRAFQSLVFTAFLKYCAPPAFLRIYLPVQNQSMWTCQNCGESSEDQYDSCWKCTTPRGAEVAGVPPPIMRPPRRLTFRSYRGTMATWEELFSAAARFASDLGPDRLLNISHSVDDDDGVVTVWYWTTDGVEDGTICGV